jgi:hypothetical protein
MGSPEQTAEARGQRAASLKYAVRNRCTDARVALRPPPRSPGLAFLCDVWLAGDRHFSLFTEEEAECVADFCNLVAGRLGPRHWHGEFFVEEVSHEK